MNRYYCSVCGKELKWGDLAWEQKVCWDCYCQEAVNLMTWIKSDREMTLTQKRIFLKFIQYNIHCQAERNFKDRALLPQPLQHNYDLF